MQSLKKLTDEQVAEITRNENKEAYEELVIRYEKKLMRYAKYLIKDNNKAADAVQNTFIKAYENLQGFNTSKKFSSWIYRIAHNEAINEAKKYSKEIEGTNIIWSLFKSKEKFQPENEAEKELIKKRVGEYLEKLPVKYKEVLILYYLEEMKYEEISEIMRVPVNTIGTWLVRGKQELKKICEADNAM